MNRLPPRLLLLALAVVAAAWGAAWLTGRVAAVDSGTPAETTGSFAPNAQYPGEPLARATGVRLWGSWSGHDDNQGTLRLGPFSAPAQLALALSGYPRHPGNALRLQRVATGEAIPLEPPSDVGERWHLFPFKLPPAWVGQPVVLLAEDHATGLGGWFGVSEPLRDGRLSAAGGFFATLCAWLVNGLGILLLGAAAARLAEPRLRVPPAWFPLVVGAFVAAAGAVALVVYFVHPLAGRALSYGLLVAAAVIAVRPARTTRAASADLIATTRLLLVVGFFYVALLHLFPSSYEFYDLTANRFRAGLPGDNTLPHNVAVALYDGQPLRNPNAEWFTSDRPPLQSGWQLLTLPLDSLIGIDRERATGTAGIWFQLLWIPAVFALLQSLGLRRGRAAGWTAVLSLSGFLLQNTVFVWPKLSAGAFACGAFALWVFGRGPRDRLVGGVTPPRGMAVLAASAPPAAAATAAAPVRRYALGGMLAGLAWLSHGGVAFSFLALAPWVGWRIVRGELRGWVLAALAFAAFALPWFAYQKFYDPPGDRLIKMHLAGLQTKDPRSAWSVIRAAYHSAGLAQVLANKRTNFAMITIGDWKEFLDVSPRHAEHRQVQEFFFTIRAFGWWCLGALALALAVGRRPTRQALAPFGRRQAAALAWVAGTILLWCLLMFQAWATCIHQGSYATMLVGFVLLSVWIDAAATWLVWPLLLVQTVSFATTWACANAEVRGPPAGWPFVAVGAALVGAEIIAALRRSETPEPPRA